MLKLFKNQKYFFSRFSQKLSKQFSTSSESRGINRKPYDLKIGDVFEDFKLEEIREFPDFSIKSYSLTHQKTGAQFLHLDTSDQNNCFSIIFKTLPSNDKGTPHILEHLMTCGSLKFPIRDPFMQMFRRSLNSYMNAWTGPDFTAYPFSSQNEKDFKNLMNLYTSLCFEPLLSYHDFLQEGWRYDLIKNPENSQEELVYKGVVFNEMKGSNQSSQGLFLRNIYKNLYPESMYSFDSGGIPENITDLKYEELKNFFETYCHPSNMKFFSYGDFDFREHLKYLQNNYLHKYSKTNQKIEVNLAKRFEKPKTLSLKGPKDPFSLEEGKDGKFGIAYLCNNVVNENFTSFSLSILSYMLFDTPNSPFYKSLIESGVAASYCPGHGYEPSFKEASFVIGVQDINAETKEIEKIENVIDKTLKEICEKGLDKNLIEGTLHQIEVNSKIASSNFGIALLQKMLTLYNLGGDCRQVLEVTNSIQRIRDEIGKGKYFEGLIEKYLINNQHKLRLIMSSDENYTKNEVIAEKQRLENLIKNLSTETKQQIMKDNKILVEGQEKISDPNVLPGLEISDIPKIITKTTYETKVIDDIKIRYYDQPTNGLTFLRIKMDMNDMTPFIRQYLDIFNSVLPRLGTETKSHNEMSDLLSLHTTNFGLSYNSFSNYNDVFQNEQNIVLNIACLDKNIGKMLEILGELITKANFAEKQHLKNLMKNFSSERANSLTDNSLKYAISYSASQLRQSEKFNDLLWNTRFLCNFTSNLMKSPFLKEYIDDLSFHFNEIVTFLLNKNRISFSVHSSSKNFDEVDRQINNFISQLKGKNENRKKINSFNILIALTKVFAKSIVPLPKPDISQPDENYEEIFTPNYQKKFFLVSGQVNYVVESVETTHFNHEDTPKFHLLSNLLSNTILHKEIREKGGAYGSGCKFNSNGLLSFFSYRDPKNMETYEAFRKATKWVEDNSFSDQDIKEAKLTLIANFDKIQTPQEKGVSDFIYGLSDESREKYREKLLEINRQDLRHASEIVNAKMNKGETSKIIFGSEELENNENLKKNNWLFERPLEEGPKEEASEENKKM